MSWVSSLSELSMNEPANLLTSSPDHVFLPSKSASLHAAPLKMPLKDSDSNCLQFESQPVLGHWIMTSSAASHSLVILILPPQVFDATNTTRDRREDILSFAKDNGYKVSRAE